jgi:putative DNA primase/helicase
MTKRAKTVPYQEHAETQAAQLEPDARYDATRGAWYRRAPASGIWVLDETGITEYDLHRSALELEPDNPNLYGHARRVLVCHPKLAVTAAHWDKDHHLLGTPGGVFDLDDGKPVLDGYEYYVTKRTGARVGNALDCVRWRAFMLEACGDDAEQVAYLQRWAGYCLSGYTTEQALLFVYGTAGTGKGTFIETLQAVLGDYAKTLPMDSLMERESERHPADIAMLAGARMAVANETKENKRWDEARIKTLTGGDTVSARFMRENFFHFVPSFKLIVVGNFAPSMGVVDEGMRRRLHIAPFTHKPAKPDPHLRETLRGEMRGILAWCLEGFAEWRRRGLDAPESVRSATSDYFEDEDLLGQFLAERMTQGQGLRCSTSEIRAAYAEWAEENGVGSKSAKRLAGELKKRGFRYERDAYWRGFAGLAVAERERGGEIYTHTRDT